MLSKLWNAATDGAHKVAQKGNSLAVPFDPFTGKNGHPAVFNPPDW